MTKGRLSINYTAKFFNINIRTAQSNVKKSYLKSVKNIVFHPQYQLDRFSDL